MNPQEVTLPQFGNLDRLRGIKVLTQDWYYIAPDIIYISVAAPGHLLRQVFKGNQDKYQI